MTHEPVPGQARAFVRDLLSWYAAHGRALPWRATRDPFAVLVSEVMLQQTQVSRVAPAWGAFLARFPTAAALAAAPAADVLTAWRGLGYNRRAVSLQRAARAVVERHGGAVPDDLAALRVLPGVGEYTARAVLAFAFGRDEAPVDTNVARVLLRGVAGTRLPPRRTQGLATRLVPPGRGRAFGQALMDHGALTCLARRPACERCPVRAACAWHQGGRAEDPAGRETGGRPAERFAGSDRFYRGRLVDALRDGPVARQALPRAAGLDDAARLARIVAGLVADGLAEWHGGGLRLPGGATPGERATAVTVTGDAPEA